MTGLGQWLASLWDRVPVKGPIAVVVTFIGIVLAVTSPFAESPTHHQKLGAPLVCARNPLRNVYHPTRLQVVAPTCQHIRFKVVAWRLEHDGDYHVNGTVLDAPRDEWVNAVNDRSQHGYTVVEFVQGDPRPHEFLVGEILDLTCTKVKDHAHGGWFECHPVFASSVEKVGSAKPNVKALAPPTEEKP